MYCTKSHIHSLNKCLVNIYYIQCTSRNAASMQMISESQDLANMELRGRYITSSPVNDILAPFHQEKQFSFTQ